MKNSTTAPDSYNRYDGGYLESDGISLNDLVRGDEYILDFKILNKNEDDLFDYNIVVGDSKIEVDETLAGNTEYYFMDGECYNYGVNQSIIFLFQ